MIPKTTSASAVASARRSSAVTHATGLAPRLGGPPARRRPRLRSARQSSTSLARCGPCRSGPWVSSTQRQLLEPRLGQERRAAALAELALADAARGGRGWSPAASCESLRCSEPSRSSPTPRSNSSSVSVRPGRGADVVAGGEQVAGVQAHPEPPAAAGGLDQRRPAPRTSARACRRRPPCPRGAAGSGRSRPAPRAITLPARLIACADVALLGRAGVQHHAGGADPVADPQRLDQRGARLVADLRVLGGAVEQVDGVDQHRLDRARAASPRGTRRSRPRRRRSAATCAATG